MDGLLYINKPQGMTSFDVVSKIRRCYKTKSVGHTGTLDPEATGVLIVMVGKACKANPFLMHDRKEYIATIQLGKKYDTGDIWGEVIESKEVKEINDLEIREVLSSFLGKQMQIPPIYSAIKVNGKKLYEYARANQEVKIEPREIEIYEIECISTTPEIKFRVVCSSGTYIRSLCEDIAVKLGTVGAMSSLVRSKIGDLSLQQCTDLNVLLENPIDPLNVYEVLSSIHPTLEISDESQLKDIQNGKKLVLDSNKPLICMVKDKVAIAMYEKDGDIYRSKRGLW